MVNIETEFGDPILNQNDAEHFYYLKQIDATQPMLNVKVTLVWSDYAASVISSNQLVNDINLEVIIGGNVYFGNSQITRNAAPDTLNNVEQVWIGQSSFGVVVRIHAAYLFQPQSYALVVTGENIEMGTFYIEKREANNNGNMVIGSLMNPLLIVFAILGFQHLVFC